MLQIPRCESLQNMINLFTSLINNVVKPAFYDHSILICIKSLTINFINVKLFVNVSNFT